MHIQAKLGQINLLRMVRWMKMSSKHSNFHHSHFGRGRARYISRRLQEYLIFTSERRRNICFCEAFPGEIKFINWWTLMNVHEHSWTFINGSSSQFMNCVHELFIKTVHDKSWILMNTWWTNIVHESVHEVHMESFMNSHEFFLNLLGSIQLIAKFMKVHERVSWTLMNYYELDKS